MRSGCKLETLSGFLCLGHKLLLAALALVICSIFSIWRLNAVPQSDSAQLGKTNETSEPTGFWQDDWKCGRSIPITAELLDVLTTDASFTGYGGGGKLPPFLLGGPPTSESGTILFINSNNQWTAYPLQQGGGVFRIYVAPEHAGAAIFAMWTVEGPGQEYTVLSTNDGFASLSCNILPAPASLLGGGHTLDYMEIEDFNADATGPASLIGSVTFDDSESDEPQWYRATTSRLGAKWHMPQRISGRPKPLHGIYFQIEDQPVDSLIASLRASVKK